MSGDTVLPTVVVLATATVLNIVMMYYTSRYCEGLLDRMGRMQPDIVDPDMLESVDGKASQLIELLRDEQAKWEEFDRRLTAMEVASDTSWLDEDWPTGGDDDDDDDDDDIEVKVIPFTVPQHPTLSDPAQTVTVAVDGPIPTSFPTYTHPEEWEAYCQREYGKCGKCSTSVSVTEGAD